MKNILFTTPVCPVCNEIKDWLSGTSHEVEIINTVMPGNKDKVVQYKVTRVPTLVVVDEAGQKVKEAYDFDTIEEILEG